jgi:hypothetical protein
VLVAQIGGYGYKGEDISARTKSSGVFTVLVISGNSAGGYRLTLARTGAPILSTAGGTLTNGWMHTGDLSVGGLGLWVLRCESG